VILNLSAQSKDFTLTLNEMAETYTDLFTGKSTTLAAAAPMTLEPWGYRILVNGNAQSGLRPGHKPRTPDNRNELTLGEAPETKTMRARFFRGMDGAEFDAVGALTP
jgi:hypothetical protein